MAASPIPASRDVYWNFCSIESQRKYLRPNQPMVDGFLPGGNVRTGSMLSKKSLGLIGES